MKKILFSFLVSMVAMAVQAQQLPYQNPNLSADERADDLLKRLTLEEKTSLMMDQSPAIPRLGIPAFHWWNEALHGVGRNGIATVFPITMQMASSWDDTLLYRVFTAVSDEARAKNQESKKASSFKRYEGLSFWTPNINIFRDPRWGRGQETYGEDPYLTSVMGVAVVNGLQGQPLSSKKYRKLLACAKHFAVHSGPEWNRHSFDVQQLPARDLWETYLPAFKALVQEAKVAEVMCAYQRLDGQPCCGNNRLLQQILRNEWGYQGLITSDCWAVNDFFKEGCHGVSKDAAAATAKAIINGTDVECGDAFVSLPEAVRRGDISEERVNVSLRRLLKARFELGDFDPDELVEWTKIPSSVIACDEHRQMALQMAREGTVLLKNDGLLPLSVAIESQPTKITIMGPNANDSTMMWGNYNGFPRHTVTYLEGLRKVFGDIPYVEGCGLVHQQQPTAEVLKQVKDAEIIIFVGGISPKYEGEEMKHSEICFNKGDRTDIELPAVQRQLLKALHDAGKKVVLINCSGSAVALVPEQETCNAILQAWYSGEKGGEAMAEILTGQFNPCGKLPVTFYRSVKDLPDFLDYTMKNRTYRYFRGEVLYPFGFGLSYTTFEVKNEKLIAKGDGYAVSAKVTNSGKYEGTEVVQVYIRNTADVEGPLKTLRAFQRVTLKPGESKTITIDLPRERFEGWDAQTNTMRVVPGKYEVMVGTSSAPRDLHVLTAVLQ